MLMKHDLLSFSETVEILNISFYASYFFEIHSFSILFYNSHVISTSLMNDMQFFHINCKVLLFIV